MQYFTSMELAELEVLTKEVEEMLDNKVGPARIDNRVYNRCVAHHKNAFPRMAAELRRLWTIEAMSDTFPLPQMNVEGRVKMVCPVCNNKWRK